MQDDYWYYGTELLYTMLQPIFFFNSVLKFILSK